MKKLLLILALISFQGIARAEAVLETDRLLKTDLTVPGEAVLVEYSYAHCANCKIERPNVLALAREFSGKAKVIIVDCDESGNCGSITEFPEFHLYSVDHHKSIMKGAPSYNELANWIRSSGL